ncbi:MAG: AbrB/MazE/SpoVT family DNA-binding domain-containing protein [Rhizobium sp.]
MAQVKVSKWGNSIAIRFPKIIAEAMRLSDGDVIDIQVDTARRRSKSEA